MRILILLAILLLTNEAQARLLQIIHTNDLHSYLEGERTGLGGYARLKTKIDQLKAEAAAQGIPTLFLDGGDFGEGTSFYFADRGVNSLRALDELGVDIAVLGNHDFMTGAKDLARMIREARIKTKIISANLKGKRLKGLRKLIPDYVDYDLGGLKVRIFGLTTSELHFQYPLLPTSHIAPSHKAGIKEASRAKKQRVDFLIALTHIGLDFDRRLVAKSHSIDLVVGGHSHTHLVAPMMVNNLEGRPVPVLQAGAHGLRIGALLIDVAPHGKSQIIDYRSFKITPEIPEDVSMKNFVEKAKLARNEYFHGRWEEVIGFSEINLSGTSNGDRLDRKTCWSRHIARLTQELTKADIAIQMDEFQGERIPAGNIRYGDLVDNFPHFRRWGDQGWRMSRAKVNGWLLKKMISLLAKSKDADQITIQGLTVRDEKGTKTFFDLLQHKEYEALINDDPINNLRYYTIAFPSEIRFALWRTLNVFSFVLLNNVKTIKGSDYWPTMEAYIAKNSPLRCLDVDTSHN